MSSLWLLIVQAVTSSSALLLLRSSLPKVQALRFGAGAGPIGLFVLGGLLYVASFLIWMYILSKTEVTYAYPVSVALTIFMTTLGALIFLGEKFSWQTLAGIVLVVGGVAVLSLAKSH